MCFGWDDVIETLPTLWKIFSSLMIAKTSDVKRRNTLGRHGCIVNVILWNSPGDHFVQFKLNARSVEALFHYLRVQWWRDCETVSETLKQAVDCFTVYMHITM